MVVLVPVLVALVELVLVAEMEDVAEDAGLPDADAVGLDVEVPDTDGVLLGVTASAATSPGDSARSKINRSSIAPLQLSDGYQSFKPPPTCRGVSAAVLSSDMAAPVQQDAVELAYTLTPFT